MKSICLLLLTFIVVTSNAQEDFDVRVHQINEDTRTKRSCFNIQLASSNGNLLQLASQNYRVFYNSENMTFMSESLELTLPRDKYQLKLVQDRKEVDAAGTGTLDFEDNLGFINFSVVLQNAKIGGEKLKGINKWFEIANMCFKVDDLDESQTIILARNTVTSEYGRAYVELSYIDQSEQVNTASIANYSDYRK